MKLHTAIILAATTLTAIPLAADDAHACSPEYYPPGVSLVTRGELAQSAQLIVEFYGDGGNLDIGLEDASGSEILLFQQGDDAYFTAEYGNYGRRVVYAPEATLTPGDYMLVNRTEPQEWQDDSTPFDTSASFTITADLPPEGTPPSPTLTWSAVAYDGPEDPDLFNDDIYICGGSGTDSSLTVIEVASTQPDAQDIGYITVTFEDAAGEVHRTISSTATDSPELSDTLAFYEGDPFIQCISATYTDIYGRTSDPTRSCKPDECAALGRNDRDGYELRKGSLCEDWSPGFAQRNASGCACAQAPGAPAGSPAALALLALGLLGARRGKW